MSLKVPVKKSLKDRIQILRRHLNLTQAETAHVLGVTVTTLSRWTTRRTAEPDPAHQERVERLLGLAQQAIKVIRPAGVPHWFRAAHPLLMNLRPIDLLGSAAGAEKVKSLLTSMEWGLPV